jgi:hypothetical protein
LDSETKISEEEVQLVFLSASRKASSVIINMGLKSKVFAFSVYVNSLEFGIESQGKKYDICHNDLSRCLACRYLENLDYSFYKISRSNQTDTIAGYFCGLLHNGLVINIVSMG